MCKESITEVWKPIKGYEGLYEVSNLGRVKSCERVIVRKDNKNLFVSEKILKLAKRKDGYLKAMLSKNNKLKGYFVHRLVAIAFIDNPDNKPCVNHIDCNRSNNKINNLEWCTQEENIEYANKLGRMKNNIVYISIEQRKKGGEKRSKPCIAINTKTGTETYYKSQTEAAKQLNISQSNINSVLQGKYKQIKGYIFKYTDN